MRWLRVFLLAGAFLPLAGVRLAAAADSDLLAGWKKLVLADRKALFLRAEVILTLSPASYSPPVPAGEARSIPALLLTTESRMSIFGFQKVANKTESYLDPATNRSIEFFRVKKDRSAKRILFLEGFYRQIQTRPHDKKKNIPVDRWEVFQDEERLYRYPDGKPLEEGVSLHDSFALLYLIMQADLSGPDRSQEFVVLSKGKLLRVRIRAGETRNRVRKVRDLSTGKTRRLHLREKSLTLIPIGAGAEKMNFLSMKGEIEIWLEEKSQTIVEVSGEIPRVGRLELKLKAVEPGDHLP